MLKLNICKCVSDTIHFNKCFRTHNFHNFTLELILINLASSDTLTGLTSSESLFCHAGVTAPSPDHYMDSDHTKMSLVTPF